MPSKKRTADALQDASPDVRITSTTTENGVDKPPLAKKARQTSTAATKPKGTDKEKETVDKPVDGEANRSENNSSADKDAASERPNGSFDLYIMDLPFLKKALMPAGASAPNYPALYKDLVARQSKKDRSGQVNFGEHNGAMRVFAPGFSDPMEESPYDLTLSGVKVVGKTSFTSKELAKFFPAPPSTDGSGMIVADLNVDGGCGVASASGKIKMMVNPSQKMYFGTLALKVSYSGLYRRKGHGSGTNETFAFWAIKSREGDEKRI
ncbi:hypothetical protein CYLTODRAFT_489964 [Cylindrobasidium torrendii FP15055 ss-10]|uniref:Uncharacterized protein n=1 Tax=Cylindrobasidium torrendii FP15055 ss-10 TaxID=1314674 RepID=A0A0D7BDM3_9AGAR|nr:hypothetical protein CYLTODRAFT_489964 [Cylindrobasidium torrendii FP15055 ss-10]